MRGVRVFFTFGFLLVPGFGRLLKNEHVQLMWFTYCNTDRVELGSFLLAVEHYLSAQLRMPADAVESVLNPECLEALSLAVDVDGDKQVGNKPLAAPRPPYIHECGGRTVYCLAGLTSGDSLNYSFRFRRLCIWQPVSVFVGGTWGMGALPWPGDGVGGEPSNGLTRLALPRPTTLCMQCWPQ